MPEAVLTPKYVNPPKGNGKSWSVKDANGEYWYCAPEVANYIKDMMGQGASVAVVYTTKPREDGGEWKTIKSASASAQQARPAQQAAGGERYDEAQKAEDIFISGAINHAIAEGQLVIPNASVQAWTHYLMVLRSAWRASKAPPSVASTAAAMRSPTQDDEPPPFA